MIGHAGAIELGARTLGFAVGHAWPEGGPVWCIQGYDGVDLKVMTWGRPP